MYPISFDNPNQRKGHLRAANRNISNDQLVEPKGDNPERHGSDASAASSLLVVECRRDDKWRVELCTDLSELDAAMDMARALRSSPDNDEVCLTLEMSGTQGRESRREVLRFAPETSATHNLGQDSANIAAPLPETDAVLPSHTLVGATDNNAAGGMAVLNAALKEPDYSADTLDFAAFAMPQDTHASEMGFDSDLGNAPGADGGGLSGKETPAEEEPLDIPTLPRAGESCRQEARELLLSIYDEDEEYAAQEGVERDLANGIVVPAPTEDAIRVKFPRNHNDHVDWLDRTHSERRARYRQRHRLEADDSMDNAVERFEMPMLAQRNGLATKLLVFAGTIALLVLGGALAELLAVDITTTANAGVGAFDTFSALNDKLSR